MRNGLRVLGHPVHPILVHFPVACWLLTPVCDLAGFLTHAPFWSAAAIWLTGTGAAFGLLAALAGMIDLAALREDDAVRTAGWHAALMALALTGALIGLIGRTQPRPDLFIGIAWPVWIGVLTALATVIGGWFGGRLVYRHGAGRLAE